MVTSSKQLWNKREEFIRCQGLRRIFCGLMLHPVSQCPAWWASELWFYLVGIRPCGCSSFAFCAHDSGLFTVCTLTVTLCACASASSCLCTQDLSCCIWARGSSLCTQSSALRVPPFSSRLVNVCRHIALSNYFLLEVQQTDFLHFILFRFSSVQACSIFASVTFS